MLAAGTALRAQAHVGITHLGGASVDRRRYGYGAQHIRSRKHKQTKKPAKWVNWDEPPALRTGEVIELASDGRRGSCGLIELNNDTCRWPYNGGLFCGAEPEPGLPYCLNHCKRAYYDFNPRRRRPPEV